MLPTALSNHLCSLEPQVDRLCLVADMQVSKKAQLGSWRFYPAVMRSAARLTYTQAYAALFEGRPQARQKLGPLVDKLMPLVDVYRLLLEVLGVPGTVKQGSPGARTGIPPATNARRPVLGKKAPNVRRMLAFASS